MLTKTKSFFKKTLSTILSAACLLSGTAVFSTAILSSEKAVLDVSAASTVSAAPRFSWDNATVYFLLTDRFCNGDTSNDHSYGRGCDQNGNVLSGYKTEAAFQGGDFAGITKKIKEGYFDELGVNAIWLSAPYEQIHGYVVGGSASPSYLHYSYHGYYVLDYTETDKNFGTKEDFKEMVDTAHEHGIRIVCDIVMNHAGYNDLKTMSEYDFCPASGWESYYYSHQNTNNTDYHGFIDYTDSSASSWLNWWGPDWIRCGLPGGYQNGSGEVAGSLEGLPDFKTESTQSVGIPNVLKTKWTKEGTYDAKVAKYGSSGTVRSYLVKWLTEWVKEFGVDGFRCDTAKHVEMESWVALKNAGKEALNQWRQNNPSAPGADWTDDFWMTGECFGHGPDKSNYFTSGAFDSMINFAFTAVGRCNVPGADSVEGVYSSYASKFNNDPSFNMLTYLASHDTTLITGDRKYAGSFLLMCPGGVQIYYGDEICRPLAQVSSDSTAGAGHMFRSFMNWDSMDKDVLAHWQKVGQFRNNHIAVGAGQHKLISTYSSDSGYTFARTYSANGVDDKVVVTLFATPNKDITIDVSSVFADGIEVTNFYDGTTCKVSGGKVSFNTGANGTILIQEPDGEKGKVTVTHIDQDSGKTIKTETMAGLVGTEYTAQPLSQDGFKLAKTVGSKTGTYSATPAEVTFYYTFDDVNYAYIIVKHVDAANDSELAESTTEVAKVGTTYSATPLTIKNYEVDLTKSTNTSGTVKQGTTTAVFKYNFVEPTNLVVHYYNTNGWTGLNMYAYDESVSPTKQFLGAWPGKAMTDEGNGWFVCEVPDIESATVIFNGSGGQEPARMQPGYELSGEVYIKDGKQQTVSKVMVIHCDTNGKTLASETLKGMSGDTYTTSAKTISGYTLKTTPANATGTFAATTTTVTYVYQADGPSPEQLVNNSKLSPATISVGESATITGAASGGTPSYTYKYEYKKSSASSYTTIKDFSTSTTAKLTPTAAGTYNVKVTVKDSEGETAVKSLTLTVEDNPEPETLTNKSTISATSITLGSSVVIRCAGEGGKTPYKYQVTAKKSSSTTWSTVASYSTTSAVKFTPKTATTYNVRAYVKDAEGTVKAKAFTVKVNPAPLTNKSTVSATTVAATKSITITGAATGGTSPYSYAAYYKKSTADSYTSLRSYSTTKTITFTPKTSGTYTLIVKVKDNAGTVVSKTFTIKATAAPLTNKSTISATSLTLGKSVTITGAATGGTTPYQYAAYYKRSTASDYTKLRGLSTTKTITFKPTKAGTYDIKVYVKDAKGTTATKSFKVTAKAGALTNTSTPAATTAAYGSSIKITGSATGGTTPYQFAGYYKKYGTDSYTNFRSYSTTATMYFKAPAAGKYQLRLKVKDAAGTVANKDVVVTFSSSSTTALANNSFLSATSVKLGETVTVTGKPSGGTSPYKYAFSYKKASSDSFTSVQSYSTNRTVTIKPSAATKYVIRVKIQDAAGNMKSKDLTLTVTK